MLRDIPSSINSKVEDGLCYLQFILMDVVGSSKEKEMCP